MPEGDTLFRAARTLDRALAGRVVLHFETVFPRLGRIDEDEPLTGRTIERVESRGKHLLIWFSGALVLRTHMRMNGSWHIYRPGERWQRSRHDMRIVIRTDTFDAVAFSVPIAEFVPARELERVPALSVLGPDPLSEAFDAEEAVARIRARADIAIAEVLLDQSAIAGIGNVFKSEVLFVGRVNPFARVVDLAEGDVERLVEVAVKLMRANVHEHATEGIKTYAGFRRTTNRFDLSARLWVYGRTGKPCRRCGTPISRRKQGVHARSTYWCANCQRP